MSYLKLAAILAIVVGIFGVASGHRADIAAAVQDWQISAGGGSGEVAVEQFLPAATKVRVGDSVTWTVRSDEIHSIAATTGNPATDDPPDFEVIDGFLVPNPDVFLPNGTTAVSTPTDFFNAGVLGPGQTFTVTFNGAGTFLYHCNLHPGMEGEIVVEAPATTIPSQADVDADAAEELADALSLVGPLSDSINNLVAVVHPDGTIQYTVNVGATDGQVDLLRFAVEDITIRQGDSVRWVWQHEVPHTVTMTDDGEVPPLILAPGDPDNPNPFPIINPMVAAPSVPDQGIYTGSGYVNSSILGPPEIPVPAEFELTFAKSGTYNFFCSLHEYLGMEGTVTVLAPTAQSLLPGWNNVAYTGGTSMSSVDAFSGLGASLNIASRFNAAGQESDPWNSFDPALPVLSDLQELNPGDVLWLNVKSPIAWQPGP